VPDTSVATSANEAPVELTPAYDAWWERVPAERAVSVSYPTYNLELAGWDRRSVWGWDPAQESLYAQLTRNESDIEVDVHGPEIWLSPPFFPVITNPVVLAKAIADATGVGTAAARTAMNDSLPAGEHPFRMLGVPRGGNAEYAPARPRRWKFWG